MISRITEYPGYLIRLREDAPSERAILFLHGFPALRGVKNLDIADYINRQFNEDVYLLHYKGLGESVGSFKFTDSLAEASRVIDLICHEKKHKELCLVGHSWGGLVALNMAQQHPDKVQSIVLLSPFCDVKKSDALYDWFVTGVKTELKHIFGEQSEEDIAEDFETIIAHHLPRIVAPKLPSHTRVSIIQAGQDEVTPVATMKAVLPLFVKPPAYIELDQDHSFTQSRKELAEAVAKLLGNH
jgi:pimeloyl-ACP methyl ester carboxylesterase